MTILVKQSELVVVTTRAVSRSSRADLHQQHIARRREQGAVRL
ncbi:MULTISPECIES: hypothetical protein [unclassified Brachybacterium]|nr:MULTISPECIES: hypothetical protein [unclassified Brachybacterium]